MIGHLLNNHLDFHLAMFYFRFHNPLPYQTIWYLELNPNFYIEHQRERRKFSIKVFKGGVLGFADCQNQKAFKTLFEHTQKTLVYNTYVNEKLHFLSLDISKN